mmetsp:Transcript_39571/g.113918  ORF Transcript_39571/g.113918 Transcript_39571/m.113918 type:complete len:357 (+) Transcript_39571:1359-2429(+)
MLPSGGLDQGGEQLDTNGIRHMAHTDVGVAERLAPLPRVDMLLPRSTLEANAVEPPNSVMLVEGKKLRHGVHQVTDTFQPRPRSKAHPRGEGVHRRQLAHRRHGHVLEQSARRIGRLPDDASEVLATNLRGQLRRRHVFPQAAEEGAQAPRLELHEGAKRVRRGRGGPRELELRHVAGADARLQGRALRALPDVLVHVLLYRNLPERLHDLDRPRPEGEVERRLPVTVVHDLRPLIQQGLHHGQRASLALGPHSGVEHVVVVAAVPGDMRVQACPCGQQCIHDGDVAFAGSEVYREAAVILQAPVVHRRPLVGHGGQARVPPQLDLDSLDIALEDEVVEEGPGACPHVPCEGFVLL